MNTIQIPISSESITGFKRIAKHENFVITPSLNMIQQVRVVTVDEDDVPILEKVATDESISATQRQNMLLRYQDQIVSRNTEGAFVDGSGAVVAADVEGAISQLDFFQHITLGDLKKMGLTVTDKTPFASLLYALMGSEISKIDNRGGL